jgi:hypothetical protein
MPADTNLGLAKKGLSGNVTQQGGLATIDESLAVYVMYDKTAADGAASTATTDTIVWVNPFSVPVYIVSAYGVATGAGITADASNNATITFRSIDLAGGSSAAALTITTDVAGGTWTQNRAKAITSRTVANAAVPVGGGITFSIAKGGTGVVVPVSKFVIKCFKAES